MQCDSIYKCVRYSNNVTILKTICSSTKNACQAAQGVLLKSIFAAAVKIRWINFYLGPVLRVQCWMTRELIIGIKDRGLIEMVCCVPLSQHTCVDYNVVCWHCGRYINIPGYDQTICHTVLGTVVWFITYWGFCIFEWICQ